MQGKCGLKRKLAGKRVQYTCNTCKNKEEIHEFQHEEYTMRVFKKYENALL